MVLMSSPSSPTGRAGLGRFIADDLYAIHTPRTPAFWFNYLFNDSVSLRVGQTLQGPSWNREPVVAKWNRGSRLFFLRDRADGFVWAPAWEPLASPLVAFECRHGLAFTELDSVCRGVRCRIRVFVPREGAREVWTLRIESDQARELDVFAAFDLDDVPHMGQRTEWDEGAGAVARRAFPHHAAYEEHDLLKARPQRMGLVAGARPTSWCCGEWDFWGHDGRCGVPACVEVGECGSRPASLDRPLAVLHWRAQVGSAGWRTDFEAGLIFSDAEATSRRAVLAAPAVVDAELAAAESWFGERVSRTRLQTPDARLNRMFNVWLKKEILWETRLWRNGVTTPWRNELQDAMGYACFHPEEARPYLEEVTRVQDESGYVKVWNTRAGEKPNHPLASKVHNDGAVWLAICWGVALEQSGRAAWLDLPLPYKHGAVGPLLEHLVKGLAHTAGDVGAHGLVLMRDGDWTDPINGPGRAGRGESVWASQALVLAARMVARIARAAGREPEAASLAGIADTFSERLNRHAWFGDAFCYGFDDDGAPFGAPQVDGRVFLNTQTWALLSGSADGARAEACWKCIQELMTPFGPLLLHPPFEGWDPVVGRLSLKIPGTTENGAVYCHGSAFAAAAACLAGRRDEALDIVQRTLPDHPEAPASFTRQIPIFQANGYFGDRRQPDFGRSSHTLGTGTCSWLMLVLQDQLFGFRSTLAGVEATAHLPTGWGELRLEKFWKGCRYRMVVRRGSGPAALWRVDGKPWSGQYLPWSEDGEVCVEVETATATHGGRTPKPDTFS